MTKALKIILNKNEYQEIDIPEAGILIVVENWGDKILIDRVEKTNMKLIYEECKLHDGRWIGRTNKFADFPPRWKKSNIIEKCLFCNKTFPENPDNIALEEWSPTFWMPDLGPGFPASEMMGPVCGRCHETYLQFNEENGDYDVKPQFIATALRKTSLYSQEKIEILVRNYQDRLKTTFAYIVF